MAGAFGPRPTCRVDQTLGQRFQRRPSWARGLTSCGDVASCFRPAKLSALPPRLFRLFRQRRLQLGHGAHGHVVGKAAAAALESSASACIAGGHRHISDNRPCHMPDSARLIKEPQGTKRDSGMAWQQTLRGRCGCELARECGCTRGNVRIWRPAAPQVRSCGQRKAGSAQSRAQGGNERRRASRAERGSWPRARSSKMDLRLALIGLPVCNRQSDRSGVSSAGVE